MPLTYTQHALVRMNERNIGMDFVQATVNAGGYVIQPHGTRMYQAVYNYFVPVPVVNAWNQHQLDPFGFPLFFYQPNSILVTVITNAAGNRVVTVWWN